MRLKPIWHSLNKMRKVPCIKSERLVLKPHGIDYLDSTHIYSSDLSNTLYMIHLPNQNKEETRDFLENVSKEWEKEVPDFYEFAILLGDVHIGSVCLYLDESHETGELGWILNKHYWHHGYAFEAAAAMKTFAISIGLKRLIAHCDDQNVASYKVMEKLGMKLVSMTKGRYNKASKEESKERMYQLILE